MRPKTAEAEAIRKHLLEYDDVNNKQRNEIYTLRRGLLEGREQKDYLLTKAREILDYLVDEYLAQHKSPADWDLAGFQQQLSHFFGFDPESLGVDLSGLDLAQVTESVWNVIADKYEAKEQKVGAELMRQYERHILLQIIDSAWKDHLLAMDHLKEGINLRAYGQKDPLVEYKRESFEMFGQMKERIENDVVSFLFRAEPMTEQEREEEERRQREERRRIFEAASRSAAGVTARGGVKQVVRKTGKVGRNDPCPCGSGKKYKRCHGSK